MAHASQSGVDHVRTDSTYRETQTGVRTSRTPSPAASSRGRGQGA
eukprot:CAMPEP_0185198576 /NCGR_PEP_ID=MMETSP1140-20130426/43212_1 /TAXON_ID=298111 /ORGANISM="Pavlova sp., Strain CCMP459" /LENGTH=44 /DNA_ID= /DNA_START= /DNA_END= /DNA_ORIENTATION=